MSEGAVTGEKKVIIFFGDALKEPFHSAPLLYLYYVIVLLVCKNRNYY